MSFSELNGVKFLVVHYGVFAQLVSQAILIYVTLQLIPLRLVKSFLSVCTMYLQALVNVPSLSERTIRRDIAGGKFTVGPEIQVSVCLNV